MPDIEPAKAEVHIASPDATAYTNGVLEVRLTVTGHAPERVELLRDGEVLATLEAPYTYAWDTAGEAEGEHRLEARAVFGDVVFTSEARDVVVDRTPPQVVARTPEPGAQDVWVRSPIRAEFSEPMKASTVTDASVRLTVGEVEVARTVSLSADGKTLTVEPGSAYVASNPVSLTLTGAVTDIAGNGVIPSSEAWKWTIPYWTPWGTASGAPTARYSDRIGSYAFDSSGTLIATWYEFTGSDQILFVKRWEDREWKTYGQPLAVSSGHSPIHSDSLTLDETGSPIIAWSQSTTPNESHINVKKWTNTKWEQIGNTFDASAGLPQKQHATLEWTPSGQLAIAWTESDNSQPTPQAQICVRQWDHHEWHPIGPCLGAQPRSPSNTSPVLRFTQSGTPVIAWTTTDHFHHIHVSRLVGQDWVVFDGDHDTNAQDPYVSLQLDTTDSPLIAWSWYSGSVYSLGLVRWNQDQWIGEPLSALPGNTSTTSHSLQLDRSGAPVVVWTEGDLVTQRIFARRWNGSVWHPLDDISNSEENISVRKLSLQRTATGDLILNWFKSTGLGEQISVRRLNQ
ncbi:Ig-like domain-containing protein [Pyxidicoccus sp. 3LG]